MKSASNNAYISSRMMEAYVQKKQARQQSMQSVQKPVVNKQFSEEAKQEEMSMPQAPSTESKKLEQIEEVEELGITLQKEMDKMEDIVEPMECLKLEAQLSDQGMSDEGCYSDELECMDSGSDEDRMESQVNMQPPSLHNNMAQGSRGRGGPPAFGSGFRGGAGRAVGRGGHNMFAQQAQPMSMAAPVRRSEAKQNVYRQEADTNIYRVALSCLKDAAEMATGDPEECDKCKAVFNIHSKIETEKKMDGTEEQTWNCEFCCNKNLVNLDEEEIPKADAVNYLKEAAAQIVDKKLAGQDISVIFCLDVSGSMCVTEAVQGKHNIKGDKTKKDLAAFAQFGDGSDQFMSQAEKNVTYISRLQCVQAAVENQLQDMSIGADKRKIGVVTFNGDVTVMGDGTKDPATITGDKLNNYDWLLENGQKEGLARMQKTIGETKPNLSQQVMSIEETGPTALGPATLTAIAMASEGLAGSTVVICTDGLANVGLGAYDEAKTPEQIAVIDAFYEQVGQFAKSKGVTVNIVSIAGDECNLDSLATLAELTGGNVERVSPANLKDNFANILAKPVIASQVCTRVKIHKGMQFRNENAAHLSEDKTMLVRDMGNVTEDNEFTFEYTLKSLDALVEMDDLDLSKITHLPFQAQITYTGLDGAKYIRVITQMKEVSSDRQELEKKADFSVMAQNCIQQCSNMAKEGNYRQAQTMSKVYNRKMKANVQSEEQCQVLSEYNNAFGEAYNMMGAQNMKDRIEEEEEEVDMGGCFGGGGGCEDYDEEMESKPVMRSAKASAPKARKKQNDKMSSVLFQGSKFTSQSMPSQQMKKK